MNVRIEGVGTAVPDHVITQPEVRRFARGHFGPGFSDIERLLPLFENTGIEKRHFVMPEAWYAAPHTFAESNAAWQESALLLSEQAARSALEQAGIGPDRIGAVIFVTTTGLATPSLDAALIQRLGIPMNAHRTPIWGLGCAGGVSGLARAAEAATVRPGSLVLLVAVECCSLTFQQDDLSKANLVGISLFADGAAAAVVGASPAEGAGDRTAAGPAILDSRSRLMADSDDVMGWDIVATGLKVRFSRSIPALVDRDLSDLVEEACASWGIARSDLRHVVAHPGGAKVLDAYASALDMEEEGLDSSWRVLRQYGNMSSPTVLFVLREFLRETPRTGDYGIMLALGPGFSAEQVLFRW